MDERVIDYPYLFRLLLVKGIIVPFRAAKSAEAYSSIWTNQGSPLVVLTRQLQQSVQTRLAEPVEIAMRYGHPTPTAAYQALVTKNPGMEEVILVPLYPHYAMSSYETAVEYMKEIHKKNNYSFRLVTIKPFYNNRAYIQALAESIKPYLQHDFDKLLFSYHGVPERHIIKGDVTGNHCLKQADCCEIVSAAHQYCYRHQCIRTTTLVTDSLGLPKQKYQLSFQSRLGRDKWLTPYTAQRLGELPKEGVKKILVGWPAFGSGWLENLEGNWEKGWKIFFEGGGEFFTKITCLNTQKVVGKAIAKMMKK